MTPPTTARMMSVTVLSTSSTSWPEQGEKGGGKGEQGSPGAPWQPNSSTASNLGIWDMPTSGRKQEKLEYGIHQAKA